MSYDRVYRIALSSKNQSDLKTKLGEASLLQDLDAQGQLGKLTFTVASRLAFDEDNERVAWFRAMGAKIDPIAHSYAIKNQVDLVDACFNAGAACEEIVRGYALGGHHEQVKIYRNIAKGHNDPLHFQKIIDHIALGYAQGGYPTYVEKYCYKYQANVALIANFYRSDSNEELLKKFDMSEFLNDYLIKRKNVRDSDHKIREFYFDVPFFTFFQVSYTEKQIAVLSLQQALKGIPVAGLVDHLPALRNGELGKGLRAFVKTGKANHLVGEKVETVTQFIQALQKKNQNDFKNSI